MNKIVRYERHGNAKRGRVDPVWPGEVHEIVPVQYFCQAGVLHSIDKIAIGNTDGIEAAVGRRPVEMSLLCEKLWRSWQGEPTEPIQSYTRGP